MAKEEIKEIVESCLQRDNKYEALSSFENFGKEIKEIIESLQRDNKYEVLSFFENFVKENKNTN